MPSKGESKYSKDELLASLTETDGNISTVAKMLGTSRVHVYYLMNMFNIECKKVFTIKENK